ncbi:MAG: L,D-transpeptidase family protein [Candidatus Electrothrix aestuarii]|uniref:L,D-transpeptidase family protein n=1 Tax=Candidatus Electrothrix aestuarii TaxID=3062594 RepID=A0AAU8LST7_9BACT|nr:L,D-transpeptidase family protein [Candidatus Electrothrix aestuarii]
MSLSKLFAVCAGVAVVVGIGVSSVFAHIDEEAEEIVRSIPATDMTPLQRNLFWFLENKPSVKFSFIIQQQASKGLDELLFAFYQENNFFPYWVTEYGPTRNAHILLSVLRRVDEEGLELERYKITDLTALLVSRETADLAQLDLMFTLALYTYLGDMLEGAVASCMLDPGLFDAARSTAANRHAMLREAVGVHDFRLFLKNLSPRHYDYQSLKKTLAKYRRLAARGGWPEIPPGETLRPGMEDPRVRVLAERLFITGDLKDFSVIPAPPLLARPKSPPGPIRKMRDRGQQLSPRQALLPPSWWMFPLPLPVYHLQYSNALLKAVQHFQQRYSLEQDGVIGKKTLSALNLPVQDHINKLILNMERWRWLPHQLEGRRIIVNVAGFRLVGMHDRKVEISMPVIVGKVRNKTPIFSHIMTYIEVNPYWNIPPNIARNEIVPKVLENPLYLQEQRIRIFADWQEGAPEILPETIDWENIGRGINQFHLRQEPGPGNALGTMKFMFPNTKNIYLHDTPAHGLFRRARRAFSHGCIRVSRPLELASYILTHDYQMISRKQLEAQVASHERKIFVLNQPLPVHLIYRTARVDRNTGAAYFYDDIYGRDARLAAALFPLKKAKCRYTY